MVARRGHVLLAVVGLLGACGGRTVGEGGGAQVAGATHGDDNPAAASGGNGATGGGASSVRGPAGGFASESVDPIDLEPTDPFARNPRDGIVVVAGDGYPAVEPHIATDAEGQVYLAAATGDPATLGHALPSGRLSVVFVARLTADGELVWREPLADCGRVAEIVIGPGGDPWVVCPFLPQASTVSRSGYTNQATVLHLNAIDARVMRKVQIERDGDDLRPRGLAVDAAGVAYVGGSATTDSYERSVVYRIEPDGEPEQFWMPTSSTISMVNDVAAFANGQLVATGAFTSYMESAGEHIESLPAGAIGNWAFSGFVGRPGSSSAPVLQHFGGEAFDFGWAVEPRPGGGIALVGALGGAALVGGLTAVANVDGSPFVALLDDAGNGERLRALPGMGVAVDVAVREDGRTHFVGGLTDGALVYSYDPVTDTLISHDQVEGESYPTGVAVGADDTLWVVGRFSATTDDQSAYLVRLDAPMPRND